MENTEQKEIVDTNKEVAVDELPIGEDVPQVEAKTVLVEDYELAEVKKNDKKIADKLVLKVKHPDMEDLVEISGVKYQSGDKLKVSGLWIKVDKDGKLAFNSATASLLRHLNKPTIKDLKGEQVDTVADDKGYLVVKGY